MATIRPMTQAQRTQAQKSPSLQPFGGYFGAMAYTAPKKKTKKKTVKPAISVAQNINHKDMMGRPINEGDFVLAVQNNRPYPFSVVKLNQTTITIKPAIKWRQRGNVTPTMRHYRREGWNVYIIPKEEVFMFTLAGHGGAL